MANISLILILVLIFMHLLSCVAQPELVRKAGWSMHEPWRSPRLNELGPRGWIMWHMSQEQHDATGMTAQDGPGSWQSLGLKRDVASVAVTITSAYSTAFTGCHAVGYAPVQVTHN